jgi:hypothetical protein
MSRHLLALLITVCFVSPTLPGCVPAADDDTGGPDDDDTGGPDDDSAADDDTAGDDDTGPEMPPDPTPITLNFSGDFGDSLVFDHGECERYPNPTYINFRSTWRSSSHNAVLITEILSGAFDGPGTYTEAISSARIKLQNEAGEPYYNMYYATESASGDTLSITVEHIDEDRGWGEFTFSGLRGSEGTTSAAPMPVPIWCDDVMD